MTESGKLAGKTEWAGRRRPATRRAGFRATARVELDRADGDGYRLRAGQSLTVTFTVPESEADEWSGFGGWFLIEKGVYVALDYHFKHTLTTFAYPAWNKIGALKDGADGGYDAVLTFDARHDTTINLYGFQAGGVQHDYLDSANAALRSNMWSFAPEANFYDAGRPGSVVVTDADIEVAPGKAIDLKSCNRCGRYLPVNLADERAHLSFSSHCVAEHRRPCRHASFGRLPVHNSTDIRQLEYGFQLECRFCKKFEVNAAHNPQRTAGQMKEDGARRRHLELLLDYLYGGSPQLRYKNETGRDLAQDIYTRFEGRCFKCGSELPTVKKMHLDHTRPLAMLWPLDSTATALCKEHNTQKRDRPPVDFYTSDELKRLAQLTGVPLDELRNPSPNTDAVDRLGENLDWFHNFFLELPQLQRVHDGKRTADLVIKALQKVLSAYPGSPPFRLG